VSAGRVAVVTGGASGIGHATALRLASEGDHVVVVDRNDVSGEAVAREIVEAGGRAEYRCVDVSDEAAVAALLSGVEESVGPVDVLVNSAGLLQNALTSRAMSIEDHDRIWAVNYRGTYLCCRDFGAAMRGRGRGSIVNLASIASYGSLPLPAYTPGKAAVKSLTELMAVELGVDRVRVNAVAPTYTLTPAIKARIQSGDRDPEAIRKAGAIEMFVEPEHVAAAIRFLCSEDAAAITGVTLPVDAGWLAAIGYRAYVAPVTDLE
jgi:NAD(P)-dependent dehydrogenase (short-subunit alcohol dehydrogenase family)